MLKSVVYIFIILYLFIYLKERKKKIFFIWKNSFVVLLLRTVKNISCSITITTVTVRDNTSSGSSTPSRYII